MKIKCVVLLLGFVLLAQFACQSTEDNVYPYRWFYVSRNLSQDEHVEQIRDLVQTAAAHGLNGMYFSSGFDSIDLKSEE